MWNKLEVWIMVLVVCVMFGSCGYSAFLDGRCTGQCYPYLGEINGSYCYCDERKKVPE